MIDFIIQAWTIGKCERSFLHDLTVAACLFPALVVVRVASMLVKR